MFESMMRRSKNQMRQSARRLTLQAGFAVRWLVVLLGLAALGSQSFLVKPHFHALELDTPHAVSQVQSGESIALAQTPSANLISETKSGPSQQEEAPADPDLFDCSICQSAHQNGHMLKPAENFASLATDFHSQLSAHAREIAAKPAISFNWQTRAPPHA